MSQKSELKNTILIVDDEPHYMSWMFDFIESLGYKYTVRTDAQSGIQAFCEYRYRAVVVDLYIPASEQLKKEYGARNPLFAKYPGLIVADYARNRGERDRQVFLYSAWDVEEVETFANTLYIDYVVKGRPREFKHQLKRILEYDPTEPKS